MTLMTIMMTLMATLKIMTVNKNFQKITMIITIMMKNAIKKKKVIQKQKQKPKTQYKKGMSKSIKV